MSPLKKVIAWQLLPLFFFMALALFSAQARHLAGEKARHWPVRTFQGLPHRGLVIDAGSVVNGSAEEAQLRGIAPYLLCQALRQHPAGAGGTGQFRVTWASTVEASSGMTVELNYDRTSGELYFVGYGIGDAHGDHFSGVTDAKLFQIVEAAGDAGKIDLQELQKLGCKWNSY